MSTRGLLLSRFPPGVPLWPGLLLGLVAATVVGYAHAHGYWPAALPLPPGNHLHPVALVGHGLALALVVTLVLEALRLRPRWQEAEDCSPSEPRWAGAAVRDCLDLLPARCTFKAYEKKLFEVQQRWASRLDRRWLWYYCAALGLFVPGAVLVPLGLRPSSQPPPDPVTLFEPLAVAALETVIVFLFALRLRIRWGDVLQLWVEAALEGQKRNARLRRKRSAAVASVAEGLQPADVSIEARSASKGTQARSASEGAIEARSASEGVIEARSASEGTEAESAGYQPAATAEPPPPLPSHPTPLPDASAFAVPLDQTPVEMTTDEVELVFDNDGYEATEGLPP